MEAERDALDEPDVPGDHEVVVEVVGEGQDRLEVGRRVHEVGHLHVLGV